MRMATVLLLLTFVTSFLVRTDFSFDQDLGRHIKLGEIITQTGQIPKTNLFSYTYPDFPFINHHYLFEILVFLGHQALGIQGLLIIKALITLAAVALILTINKKTSLVVALPVSFIFLHAMRERVELRPEIFSFLFTALTYFILERFDKRKSPLIWVLPAVQLLWVNMHIYFPIGFLLQAIFLSHFLFKKEFDKAKIILKVLSVSFFLGLVNPNGIGGFTYPLQVFGNYGYTIAENQSMFLLESLGFKDPDFLFVKLSALLVILSVIIAAAKQRLSFKNLLICLAGLTLALVHIRSFPYLVFLALPATLENFSAITLPKWSNVFPLVFAFLLIIESTFYLTGNYYKYLDESALPVLEAREQGEKAMDFVLKSDLPGPIFNNFDIGSYIIYRGFPKYRVFVDGRPEGYPKEFFQNIYIPAQNDPKLFDALDYKYNFQTIIFSHTDQTPWGKSFLASVVHNPKWKTVFLDDFMIVLVKDNILEQKHLVALDLKNLKPEVYKEVYKFESHASYLRLSLFLANTQNWGAAGLFTQKALSVFPESPAGNLIMGNLLSQSSDLIQRSQATEYLKKSRNPIWW